MPINPHTGKRFYTPEQKEIAEQASALEYARSQGYQIERHGGRGYYHLKEHDSLVFSPDGKFFWNSQEVSGTAIQFMQYYEGRTYVDAICELAGESMGQAKAKALYKPKEEDLKVERAEFKLPPKADNYKRAYAYLLKNRAIDKEILNELVNKKLVYESRDGHNAVFVNYDKDGTARAAFQRGTLTSVENAFKRDVLGSDKNYGFRFFGNENAKTLKVFEAAIDAVSEACIEKTYNRDWKSADRLALGGVADIALHKLLEDFPNKYTRIELCLDNDDAGNKAASRIQEQFEEKFEITRKTSKGKDFNEDLQKLSSWKAMMDRRIEAIYIHENKENIPEEKRLTRNVDHRPAHKEGVSSAQINKYYTDLVLMGAIKPLNNTAQVTAQVPIPQQTVGIEP